MIEKGKGEISNIHKGHRQRLKDSVSRDPDLGSFSDIEVLEYVLMFVIPRKDTNPIAHALINKFGSLYNVFKADYNELIEVPEVTKNAASLISESFAIMRKIYFTRSERDIKISNLWDSINTLTPYFEDKNSESAYILCLDVHERLICAQQIQFNDKENYLLDTVSVVRTALKHNSVAVILARNSTNGDWRPSEKEIKSVKMIYNALNALDICFADYIILTEQGYFSFFMAQIIPFKNREISLKNGLYSYNEKRDSRIVPSYFKIKY